ncbi:MAG: MBL fold metallo-hydrolase [Myxococcota bacterium]|nr:MBL fold metallo-hydrolase [Myxococcota bacterium]
MLLDLGRPLDAGPGARVPLPPVDGLDGRSDSLLGILLSHPHCDHWGLVPEVPQAAPIYMGAAASQILREAAFFGAGPFEVRPAGFLSDRTPFDLGPFRITPYAVDHSAFDAYALLVEADGQRLFYTGDFRGHGRKAALFARLLREPPDSVDTLLMEGTRVLKAGQDLGALATEVDVERDLQAFLEEQPGPVLVAMSAQNIDRLVSVFRACRSTDRTLVVDLYAAAVARATGRATIPQPGFAGYRVWVPQRQRVLVKEAEEFERVRLGGARIFPEELTLIRDRSVFLFRPGLAAELARAGVVEHARLVWSLWPGYLRPPHDARIRPFLDQHCIAPVVLHCSGHATVADLRRLVGALRPRRVVPIHTLGRDRYPDLFADVTQVDLHDDGDWWEVRR